MLDAAFKALNQMFSPPFRKVLWKSIGLAVLILILSGIGLQRLLVWLSAEGGAYLENAIWPSLLTPLNALLWVFAVVASLGLIAGAVFLMPAVTAFVAAFFSDEIAEQVERTHYPQQRPGTAISIARALIEGGKTAGLALLIYFAALPFLLFAGIGLLIFFFATAYLLGREYFLLAATRFRPVAEAKALRQEHRGTIFLAGMFIAAFVSIPIVNLATPLFGTAFMVHLHKQIARSSDQSVGRISAA